MKEIETLDELRNLCYDMEGIIISIPKNPLLFNSEFYIIKSDIRGENELLICHCGYNTEDGIINGFSMDSPVYSSFRQATIDFKDMNYYYFEDLKDFCKWYLNKEEKKEKDIDKFIEETNDIHHISEDLIAEQKKKDFYDQNKEFIYLDIYEDPHTDKRLKEQILDIYPHFKKTKAEINTYKKVDKEWIHEKCGTNTPPSTVPKQPSWRNKLMSLDDTILKKYRGEDVYTHDEIRENIEKKKKVTYFEQEYGFNPYEEEPPEKLCYWEIYNDKNCDNKLKTIIEKKWPEIKELLQNKNHRALKLCSNLKEIEGKLKLYTNDEIRDMINPGWNTRRAQLQDVIEYIKRYENICDLRDRVKSTTGKREDYLQAIKDLEDWLDEKLY